MTEVTQSPTGDPMAMAVSGVPLHEVISTMRQYGGGFASALSYAMLHADRNNLSRIVVAFPELLQEYAKLARDKGTSP